MDLYYRWEPNASGGLRAPTIREAAAHLSAAASRVGVSLVRSIQHLPETAWQEFQRLLTVDALWSLCLVLAGWLLGTILGGPVGLAVNGVLMVYGLVELWAQIQRVGGTLQQAAMTAYQARREADLDTAGQRFAAALSLGGITLLEVVVTHRVFRAVEGKLRERFPTPEWLRTQYAEEARRRAATQRAETDSSWARKGVQATEVVKSGVRGEGMRRVADHFTPGALVVGSVFMGVGVTAALTWAVSRDGRKGRP